MPARTIQAGTQTSSPEQVAKMLTAMSGLFDDPIAQCRTTWGPLIGSAPGTRTLTLEVTDRLSNRYPPTAFRNTKGKSPGRWLVAFWFGSSEYSGVLVPGVTWDTGLSLGTFGSTVFMGCTDASGIAKVTIDKGVSGAIWCHHAVLGLWRSTGIDWASGGEPGGAAPDEPAKGGGGGVPPVTEF